MLPGKQWLEAYEKLKPRLACPSDLSSYFTAGRIAGLEIDRLAIGSVSLPDGGIIVCDPFFLEDEDEPFFQYGPAGEFPVTLAVIKPVRDGCARYAAARVLFSDEEAVRYSLALSGSEDFEDFEDGDFFGFGVETGLACICDTKTRAAFAAFREEWYREHGEEESLCDDYFEKLFAENARLNPRYQRAGGGWLNWQIPDTEYHIPFFASGFGEGCYPSYFGYAAGGSICSLVIQMIDIELASNE
ncbi:MAG: DUF4241 domain-containing protein [Deltaproteobacteria bacterium]|nr:DUF4241 domain-containing protein [Deltaproteobacteria bacterium]